MVEKEIRMIGKFLSFSQSEACSIKSSPVFYIVGSASLMETQCFYWLDKSLWEQVFQASTILSESSYSTPTSLIVFSNKLLAT